MVIESLESRAMLAGLGQDSLSGLGSTTAVLLPGVSSPPGIVLTGGSPTLGSAAGTGGSQSTGPVLLCGTGSGTGSSTSGSGSSTTNGPVLFCGTGSGSGSSTGGSGSSTTKFQTADTGNQGTGESDASQSDEKSRARSWWGIRGWFLGDEPIDDGGAQVIQTADTGKGQDGGHLPAGRPTWNDAQDDYFGPRWLFEIEAGMGIHDPQNEESKSKDEFDSIPTDENGNYAWKTTQDFKDFIGRTVQLGKDFAWHMAEWFGDRAIGATAQGGVKLIDAAGASLPLWFVTRCGTVIERGSVALGLSDRLDNFATTIGGQTWKQLVPESPELWRRKFLELLNDGQTRFTFNLDGVDVWAGMARAAKGSGGFTDWELLQLRMAKDSWKRITWMKDGVVVACPFE
jgi:hypothetical protein